MCNIKLVVFLIVNHKCMIINHLENFKFRHHLSNIRSRLIYMVDRVWKVMAHAHKPDFVFRRNGRVHINRRGRQFVLVLVAELCASAVVMLDTPCSEVVWSVLAIHSIRQFPLHFPSRASPCAVTFQRDSTWNEIVDFFRTWLLVRKDYIPYTKCTSVPHCYNQIVSASLFFCVKRIFI